MSTILEVKVNHILSARRFYDPTQRKEMIKSETAKPRQGVLLSAPERGHGAVTINCLQCGVPVIIKLKSLHYRLLVLGGDFLAALLLSVPLAIAALSGTTNQAILGLSLLASLVGLIIFIYGLSQLGEEVKEAKTPDSHYITIIPPEVGRKYGI